MDERTKKAVESETLGKMLAALLEGLTDDELRMAYAYIMGARAGADQKQPA